MAVDIRFGESAASIREKVIQDRDSLRARLARAEQEVLDLRQQDRELAQFLKTLDKYDPNPVQQLKVVTVGSLNAQAAIDQATRSATGAAHPVKVDSINASSIEAAMKGASASQFAATFMLDPLSASSVSAAALAAGSESVLAASTCSVWQETKTKSASIMDGIRENESARQRLTDMVQRHLVTSRKIARPGTNMRRATDEAYAYLTVMEEFASTDQLVNFIRAKPEIYQLLGTRPAPTLSSYLSRDPRFDYQRPHGWTLSHETIFEDADQGGIDEDASPMEGGV